MIVWRTIIQRELLLLVGMFRQPVAAIRALRGQQRQSWIPLLLLTLVMLFNSRMTQDIANRELNDLMDRLLMLSGENAAMVEELLAPEEEPAPPDLLFQLISLGVVALVGRWLLAVLLRVIGSLFLRRDIRFSLLFTLSAYLGYIHAAGILLRLPLQLWNDSVRAAFGPGVLISDPNGFVMHFFAGLDLIHLWEAGLAGLGLGLLLESDDHLRPVVVVVGLYLLWKILAALSTSAVLG